MGVRKVTYFENFNVEEGSDQISNYVLIKDRETEEVAGSVYYTEVPNGDGTAIFYLGYGDKLHPYENQDKVAELKSKYPRLSVEIFKWIRKNLPQPYYAAFANEELKRALRAEPTGMRSVDIVTGEPVDIHLIRRSSERSNMSIDDKLKRIKKSLDSEDEHEYSEAAADLWESVMPDGRKKYLEKYHSPQKSTEELNAWAEEEMKKIDPSGAKTKKMDRKKSSVNLTPPEGVRAAARRGIKYHSEGKAGDGFESATLTRARKIAEGKELTPEHVKRMHSFFERHAGGRSEKAGKGEVTPWDVAWLAWGGNAGRSWAASKVKEMERSEKKSRIEARIAKLRKKISKDCNCWEGYKRVPGTEPCAPGSCEKCDSHRKKKKKK